MRKRRLQGSAYELLERIREALSDNPGENAVALSLALVEQAMQIERRDGSRGNPLEVKNFVNDLTSGMVDICAAGGFPENHA